LSIDLDSTEGRKQYLSEKLDDLLEGINDSYGTILMEELLSRLGQLVKKEQERQQLLEMLKSTAGMPATTPGAAPLEGGEEISDAPPAEPDEPEEDIPEWEKKLAKLEKK